MSDDTNAGLGDIYSIKESGLLWLINRQVFHPRGYALALDCDPNTREVFGWQLLGAGKEVWNFEPGTENELFESANRILGGSK